MPHKKRINLGPPAKPRKTARQKYLAAARKKAVRPKSSISRIYSGSLKKASKYRGVKPSKYGGLPSTGKRR